MRAVRLRAPARDRGADDDEVAVDDRRHRPAAVRREGGELLADRAFPQQLAVLAERDDGGADAQRVDVAGLGIGGGRRPADAVRRHVALKDVELVFPDHLAGVGVERHDALLQLGAAAGRVLDVDAVAHDDRRRASAVRRAPQEILAVERPLLDQPRFGGAAVAIRPARFGPVAERDPGRPRRRVGTLGRGGRPEGERERDEKRGFLEHVIHACQSDDGQRRTRRTRGNTTSTRKHAGKQKPKNPTRV